MSGIKISAPGKLHLLGEHAVVYNKPAILAAVDKRCFIEITPRKDNKIKITSKNYKSLILCRIGEVKDKFEKAQKDWETYNKSNDTLLLKSITKGFLDYSQIIIGQFLNFYKLKSIRGFDLSIDSQVPIGCGMGSSGALAVSIIGALSLFAGKKFDKKIINEIAFLCEQKKHKNQKERIEKIFNEQELLVRSLIPALEQSSHEDIIRIIRNGEKNLEKLGVVSPFVQKIIRDIEETGGAAKICGGGGKTKSTGIILIYHTDLRTLRKMLKSHQFVAAQLTLGVEGLRKE